MTLARSKSPDDFPDRHDDGKTNVQGIKLRHRGTVRYGPRYQVRRRQGAVAGPADKGPAEDISGQNEDLSLRSEKASGLLDWRRKFIEINRKEADGLSHGLELVLLIRRSLASGFGGKEELVVLQGTGEGGSGEWRTESTKKGVNVSVDNDPCDRSQ